MRSGFSRSWWKGELHERHRKEPLLLVENQRRRHPQRGTGKPGRQWRLHRNALAIWKMARHERASVATECSRAVRSTREKPTDISARMSWSGFISSFISHSKRL